MNLKTINHPDEIPTFQSVEEEAAFWDTHEFGPAYPFQETGIAEDSQATLTRVPAKERSMTMRMSVAHYDQLAALAHARGIGPSTLARMWLLERLGAEEQEKTAR